MLFLKPGYHQHLLKMFYTGPEMILNLTSAHWPEILSSRTPEQESTKKFKPQKIGSSWVKFRTKNMTLQTRFQTQKYGTHISIRTPPWQISAFYNAAGLLDFKFRKQV